MELLRLVPIFFGQHTSLLDRLAARLELVFGMRVESHVSAFDPEVAFNIERNQYNSRILLAQLLRDAPQDGSRVLGVTGLDLFIPVLSYVFGEAQLDGRAAIVSNYRLDNSLYGLPPSPELLFDRTYKVAIHELGHTFALVHCHEPSCIMASSTTVDGIDVKSEHFCPECDAFRLDRSCR